MVSHGFWLVSMVFQVSFMVSHGFWLGVGEKLISGMCAQQFCEAGNWVWTVWKRYEVSGTRPEIFFAPFGRGLRVNGGWRETYLWDVCSTVPWLEIGSGRSGNGLRCLEPGQNFRKFNSEHFPFLKNVNPTSGSRVSIFGQKFQIAQKYSSSRGG